MRYRPEIDGIRTVAVMIIVLYHAKFSIGGNEVFSGGFIGVDIFFVISGYLITSILLKEIVEKRFELLGFYERRARRILPVLFLVIFVSVPFAWMYMLPDPFQEYAGSIIASIGFVANFYFLIQDSYAAEPSLLKPFLHIWSLSVEEQFYLFFPIVLVISWRFIKRDINKLIIFLLLSSFYLSAYLCLEHPDTAFFLLPSRVWQLLAGAWLALLEIKHGPSNNKTLCRLMPAIGMLLIVIPVFSFTDEIPHPSFPALIPIAGVMLLIWFSGHNDRVSQILMSKTFVGGGLISYSLYLWHQPVFVFSRIKSVNELTTYNKIENIALSLILSIVSWWLVERTFRSKKIISKKVLWLTLTVSMSIIILMMSYIYQKKGMQDRVPPILQKTLMGGAPWSLLKEDNVSCFERRPEKSCYLGDPSSSDRWVVVSDSHLATISPALWGAINDRGGSLLLMLGSMCPYVPGLEGVKGNMECDYDKGMSRRKVLLELDPSIVLIGGRLPLYLSGEMFDNKEGGVEGKKEVIFQPKNRILDESERMLVLAQAITDSIEELLRYGHKVVLVYPIPEVGWNVPDRFLQLLPRRIGDIKKEFRKNTISTSYKVFKDRSASSYQIYDSITDHPNLIRIYPEQLFCDTILPMRCITHDDKDIFYFDSNHLSLSGSHLLLREIMKATSEKWIGRERTPVK